MAGEDAPRAFIEKVKTRMETEHLGIRGLARLLHISPPVVSELVTYGKKPSLDTTLALAKWLGQSDVSTLREAGLLPPGPPNEVQFENWEYLLAQLPPEEQEQLYEIGELMVSRRKRAEEQAASAKRKPAKGAS